MPKSSKKPKDLVDLGHQIDNWMGKTFGGGTDGGGHSAQQQKPPKPTKASSIRAASIGQSSYNRQRNKRTPASRNQNKKIY